MGRGLGHDLTLEGPSVAQVNEVGGGELQVFDFGFLDDGLEAAMKKLHTKG